MEQVVLSYMQIGLYYNMIQRHKEIREPTDENTLTANSLVWARFQQIRRMSPEKKNSASFLLLWVVFLAPILESFKIHKDIKI